MMIKKLLLTFSFIALVTITYGGTTYAAAEGETIVITEELSNLNKLYIEGFITEEEFSKAKSILLNPDSDISKKKKKKLTAAERRDLEELEKEELKAAKEAEKERKRKRKSEERKRQAEEKELARQTCKDNPEVKCPSTVLRTLKKLNIFKKN